MRIPLFARVPLLRGPLIGIFVGMVIGVVGYFLAFVASGGAAREAALLDTAFVPNKAALEALPAQSQVVLQGTLDSNTELDSNGLVAYIVHRVVERPNTSDSGKKHRWEFVESNFALLSLQMEGGSMLMTAPGDIVTITGSPHEIIDTSTELPGTARTFLYKGQNLGTGARRITGLKNGDVVTVIGVRSGNGGVQLSRVHAGDVASFRAALKAESTGTGIFGFAALALGGLIVILSILALFRQRS